MSPTPIRHRLGRRGALLLLFGIIWVGIGLATFHADPANGYPMLNHWSLIRTCAWLATGAIAIGAAFLPQGRDKHGFTALYVMTAYRISAYLEGAVWEGNGRGWINALTWAAVLTVIFVTAGWREPVQFETDGDES